MRVWDREGNQLAVCNGHRGRIISVCVTGDDKIVSGSDDKTVRVWKLLDMTNSQAERVWAYLQKYKVLLFNGQQAVEKLSRTAELSWNKINQILDENSDIGTDTQDAME